MKKQKNQLYLIRWLNKEWATQEEVEEYDNQLALAELDLEHFKYKVTQTGDKKEGLLLEEIKHKLNQPYGEELYNRVKKYLQMNDNN